MFKPHLAQLKREYWEHKTVLFHLPLILSGLVITAFVAGIAYFTLFANTQIYLKSTGELHIRNIHADIVAPETLLDTSEKASLNDWKATSTKFETRTISKVTQSERVPNDPKGKVRMFGVVISGYSILVLLIVYFVLSTSLSGDRKDKSILVWRSLPVPESRAVLSKYAHACLFVPLVYIAAFAITSGLMLGLMLLTELVISPADQILFTSQFIANYSTFLQGLPCVLLSILLAMPVLAWSSAIASYPTRYSGLFGLVVLCSIPLFERLIFGTEKTYFAMKHYVEMVFNLPMSLMYGTSYTVNNHLLLSGLGISIVCITATIYIRKSRID